MSRELANTGFLPGMNDPEPQAEARMEAGAEPMGGRIGRVLLPALFGSPFDYRIDLPEPDALALQPGAYVEVPFGRRTLTGVVWEIADVSAVPPGKIKPILGILPLPPMSETLRRFIEWVAAYTMTPAGLVLKMALAGGGGKLQRESRRPKKAPSPQATQSAAPHVPDLSPAQAEAAAVLRAAVERGGFAPILLDGVTGSGKTEVYCEAVGAALAAGRQVLVLLPEIALTAQLRDRFARRFGFAPAEWHSDMPDRLRRETWRAIVTGAAPLVLGARSALFLPYRTLGLVVADEEHEIFYKQEDGVIYQGRDLAILRAREEDCPVILASATPSLETVANVESGRYRRVHLPERHAEARLPDIRLIDLRKSPPERGRWLSPPLVAEVEDNLAAGEQSLLFLNRRGYAPLTLCRACGHRLQCPSCSAWLVAHGGGGKTGAGPDGREDGQGSADGGSGAKAARLVCHHCDYSRTMPAACPQCGKQGQLAACGPGVERLAEEAALRWPQARIAMLASDIAGGGAGILDVIGRMERREVDILIGTALVAKGHHFPWLTLVGVVDADMGLAGGDLRAGERTYQVLHQVAGRSGRAARPGRVLIQTASPDHPAMQALASGKRDAFISEQIAERRAFGMPPFGRLAAIILSASDPALLDRFARDLGLKAPKVPGIRVLGPAIAPLALLRGRHRRRFLIKGGKDQRLQSYIESWLRLMPCPSQIRLQIDIDPYSFM